MVGEGRDCAADKQIRIFRNRISVVQNRERKEKKTQRFSAGYFLSDYSADCAAFK